MSFIPVSFSKICKMRSFEVKKNVHRCWNFCTYEYFWRHFHYKNPERSRHSLNLIFLPRKEPCRGRPRKEEAIQKRQETQPKMSSTLLDWEIHSNYSEVWYKNAFIFVMFCVVALVVSGCVYPENATSFGFILEATVAKNIILNL